MTSQHLSRLVALFVALMPLSMAGHVTECLEPAAGSYETVVVPGLDGDATTYYVYDRECKGDPEYCGWLGDVSDIWIIEESNGVGGLQVPDDLARPGSTPCADPYGPTDHIVW